MIMPFLAFDISGKPKQNGEESKGQKSLNDTPIWPVENLVIYLALKPWKR